MCLPCRQHSFSTSVVRLFNYSNIFFLAILYQYDELNEFEKELKESKELWEQYPKIKFKARGMLMCWCLNFDIDPEEWRDDLAREVPVARKVQG